MKHTATTKNGGLIDMEPINVEDVLDDIALDRALDTEIEPSVVSAMEALDWTDADWQLSLFID